MRSAKGFSHRSAMVFVRAEVSRSLASSARTTSKAYEQKMLSIMKQSSIARRKNIEK